MRKVTPIVLRVLNQLQSNRESVVDELVFLPRSSKNSKADFLMPLASGKCPRVWGSPAKIIQEHVQRQIFPTLHFHAYL